MTKDTFYFSHDYNARNDIKIKRLMSKHGAIGYGVFWILIEELYNNTNVLPTDYECIAYDMRVDEKIVFSIINDFDLFIVTDGYFGSQSVERRLNERNEKSLKAKESVLKRWRKCDIHTNVLRTKCECNTIKESKGKEIKETKEDINSRKLKFAHNLKPFLSEYTPELIREFYDYWTEHGENDLKFRMEKEKTFGLSRRLKAWKKNEKNFNKNQNGKITATDEFKQLSIAIRETNPNI